MPIKTTQDKGQNLTTHVVTGLIVEEEMYKALDVFYEHYNTPLLLWDMSEAEMDNVTPEMLRNFIRKAAKIGVRRRDGKTAVVAISDLQYGFGRMSEMLFELESGPFSFRVFRSRQDAMAWLTSDTSS